MDDSTLLDSLAKGVLAQVQIFDRLTQSLNNFAKPLDEITRLLVNLARALGPLSNLSRGGNNLNSRDIFRGSLGADAVGGAINYGILKSLTSNSYRNMAPSPFPKDPIMSWGPSTQQVSALSKLIAHPNTRSIFTSNGGLNISDARVNRAQQMNVNYKPGIFEDFLPTRPPILTDVKKEGSGLASLLMNLKTPATILAAAFSAAAIAAFAFTKQMASNTQGLAISGGREGQGTQLHNLAAGLGVDDASLGARANAFGELINAGGMPANIATMMGIKAYGGPGGDRNFLSKYIKAAKNIVNDQNYDHAVNSARYLGMTDLVNYRYLSPENKQDLFNHMSELGSQDPGKKALAVNNQYLLNRSMADFMDTLKELGRTVLPIITSFLRGLIALVDKIEKSTWVKLLGHFMGGSNPEGTKSNSVSNTYVAALNTNTLSVHRMTAALEKNTSLLEGVYGGGDITNSGKVIPKALGAMQFNDAGSRAAVRFGALSL